MRTVRSKTLANTMDQKTRSNRALGKQNREQLSEEIRLQKSRKIAENLMATAVWKQAKQVLLYASYGSEVSTGLLIDAALAAGKISQSRYDNSGLLYQELKNRRKY